MHNHKLTRFDTLPLSKKIKALRREARLSYSDMLRAENITVDLTECLRVCDDIEAGVYDDRLTPYLLYLPYLNGKCVWELISVIKKHLERAGASDALYIYTNDYKRYPERLPQVTAVYAEKDEFSKDGYPSKLSAIRKEKNWTVEEIAALFDVESSSVASWLSGEREPSGCFKSKIDGLYEKVMAEYN